MKQVLVKSLVLLVGGITLAFVGCSSGGGGDGDNSGVTTAASTGSGSLTIDGTVRSASVLERDIAPGEGGLAGLSVSALGSSTMTDEAGNFVLSVDGNAFQGGDAQFSVGGQTVVLEVVPLGNMAYVDFYVDGNEVTGASIDLEGQVLSTTFNDPFNTLSASTICWFLWKPISEGNGNVVVLVDNQGATVTARGAITETFVDHGPSNDRGTTARGNRPGCAYGQAIVEITDSQGQPMSLADGTYPIVVNGCDRDERRYC